MRQSSLFSKTLRTSPRHQEGKNALLLMRAGFVHQEMAGVYSFLPLGWRVLNNIAKIVREEMNAIGGQEVFLTSLQNPDVWQKSGRWSPEIIDNWFKTKLTSGKEVGLANTHEEPMVALLKNHVRSWRDLPLYIYQIQTKFRNELRAKSGLLRTREFLMKDLYSFSRTEEEFRVFYEECARAYLRIFKRVRTGERTWRTFASGGSFSKFSDEFQTVCEGGEDTIYIDRERGIAVNEEVYTREVLAELRLHQEKMEKAKAIEVGNIFPLGNKYSHALGLKYRDEKGQEREVVMGSYGIGLGRLMGTVVETEADEKGLVWPASIAPFPIHLIALDRCESDAQALEASLEREGIEVLYDDRQEASAGEKFKDADLMGIPLRLVLSEKTLALQSVEVKERKSDRMELVKIRSLPSYISSRLSSL